jgi:CRP/FNR family cyclic AMP-dependent transcriptional regulator
MMLSGERLGGHMREILDFCEGHPRETRSAGDVLLHEGETTNRLYVLVAGKVEVLRGETQVAVLAEPGSILGDMSILMQTPHTATVRALGPVEIFAIEDGSGFFRAHPQASFHVARMLAHRLNAATTYLADLKRQFADKADHLGMVGTVLESLIYRQRPRPEPGSERNPRGP